MPAPRPPCAARIPAAAALLIAAGIAHADGAARPAPAVSAQAGIEITLAAGAWPPGEAPHVLSVLHQTADALLRHIPTPPRAAIVVGRESDYPEVLYRRKAGEAFQVRVTPGYGAWPQLIYEFGHEFCHILTRFDAGAVRRGPHPHQWFEEALCEAAGLHSLQTLARDWSEPSLGPRAHAHARALARYADLLRTEPHRRPDPHPDLATWYRANRHVLARSPYYRAKNEVVANALLEYFEADPRRWSVITNINGDPTPPAAFRDYLQHWCDATPEPQRPAVMDVMAMLGLPAPPPQTSAAERLRSAAARR